MHFNNFSRKQEQVLCWWLPGSPYKNYDAIICDGAVRSGKTLCMSLSYVLWAMSSFDGLNFAICGKTIRSCERNVITPLQEVIVKDLGLQCHYSRTLGYMDVTGASSSNRFYVFGGRDEGSAALIQGVTLAGLLLDEVALMPKSFVDQAVARCSVADSKFWFNCNPEGPQHWFYLGWVKKAKKKKALHLHFTMRDNPSLHPHVRRRYESLYDGVFYERYVLGKWVAAHGLVYPMFSEEFHVVPESKMPHNRRTRKQRERNIDAYDKYWISIDYGIQNPTSMGLWGLSGGVYYRIKEYYHSGRDGTQKTDGEYYEELEKLAGDLNVSRIIVDPSAASFITLIQRKRRFSVIAADNAVLVGRKNEPGGIPLCCTALKQGVVKFSARCTDIIREFNLYAWDEKAAEDAPLKKDDHAMDDFRYFVKTVGIANPKRS